MMPIIKAGEEIFWSKNYMRIILALGALCNFSCSYCINVRSRMNKRRYISDDILTSLFTKFASLNKERYFFNLAGGEPLLYPHLELLFNLIENKFHVENKINILTNGYFLNKTPALGMLKKTEFTLIVSTHLEQLSATEYEKILKNTQYKKNILVKIIVVPGELYKVKRLRSFCEKNNFLYSIAALQLNHEICKQYSSEEIDYLNANASDEEKIFFNLYNDEQEKKVYFSRLDTLYDPDLVHYKGMYCSTGFASIRVEFEKKISRCFTDPKKDFSMSALESLLSGPTICTAERCRCGAVFRLPKWRDPADAPEYLRQCAAPTAGTPTI
jgi:sulfatase maturation enzyme AslB (radical SAM superfamily)